MEYEDVFILLANTWYHNNVIYQCQSGTVPSTYRHHHRRIQKKRKKKKKKKKKKERRRRRKKEEEEEENENEREKKEKRRSSSAEERVFQQKRIKVREDKIYNDTIRQLFFCRFEIE